MPIKIEKLSTKAAVYDITVEKNENFFANDILVHNCTEIALPNQPFTSPDDEDGSIFVCNLAATNWGAFKNPEELEKAITLLVRFKDNLLSDQEWVTSQSERFNDMFRALGIGVNNLAYFLAKRGLRYKDKKALKLVAEFAEAQAYYLYKASAELAEERGACGANARLRTSKGVLLPDTQNTAMAERVPSKGNYDWDGLREYIQKVGIRNATLSAIMPSETSSQVINSTNGIEPVRSLVSYKKSKNGVPPQVVPEIYKLKNKYDMLWDMKSMDGYLDIANAIQLWTDQAMSTNTSYNPEHYPDGKIPHSVLLKDIMRYWKYGGKNLYYMNIPDPSGEEKEEEDCVGCKL